MRDDTRMIILQSIRRRFALVAVTCTVALLAGCGSNDATTTSGRPVADTANATDAHGPTSAGQQPAADVDPCADASGTCSVVRIVDVDGDGTDDKVAIAYSADQPSDPQVAFGMSHITTIAVINGTEHRVTQNVTGAAYTDPADIFRGAFAMSRAQGADIALHLVRGQGNAEQFAVISWDGSKLVALPQPPNPTQQYTSRTPGIWYLGSSHGKQGSIACKQPGEIAFVDLSAAMSEGIPVPGGGRREENYFVFSGNSWQPNGSDNSADSSFSYSWNPHTSAFDCPTLGRAD